MALLGRQDHHGGAGDVGGDVLRRRRTRGMAAVVGKKMFVLVILVLCCCHVVQPSVAEVQYNTYFISPNSADLHIPDQESDISGTLTSAPKYLPQHDEAIIPSRPSQALADDLENHFGHERVVRSADPILTRSVDRQFLSEGERYEIYKNVGDSLDSNDVEMSGRIAKFINPSRTDSLEDDTESIHPTSSGLVSSSSSAGEASGAPQVDLVEPQEINPTATRQMTTTMPTAIQSKPLAHSVGLSQQQDKPRQANPDIQDIITGIVKLLNGNVNVQANTAPAMGRPLRPLSTRINNRGPPRISDLPNLPPDFDVPAGSLSPHQKQQTQPPTRMPTPYPFDLPNQNTSPVRPYVNGVPLPEQIIPITSMRPGFYRPVTIPPWNRQPPRRPYPHRRPPTPIPNYRPPIHPALAEDSISITSERPMEDILTLNFGPELDLPGSESTNAHDDDKTESVSEEISTELDATSATPEITTENLLDKEFERNKEKSSSKINKHPNTSTTTDEQVVQSITSSSTTSSKTLRPLEIQFTSAKNTTVIEPVQTSITPTSVVQVIETSKMEVTTSSMVTINSSAVNDKQVLGEATPILESSIEEVMQTLKAELLESSTVSSSSFATEALPQIIPSGVAGTVESTTIDREGNQSNQGFPYYPYRPRPGIVLDDTEYKPGGSGAGTNRIPIVTARPPLGQLGEIFDITVSAIQGPGGQSAGNGKPYVIPVDIDNIHGSNQDVITSPVGNEGFVSIDGKRTYLNLFGDAATAEASLAPTQAGANTIKGTLYSIPEHEKPKPEIVNGIKPTIRRPVFGRRPTSQPPVRIDTCIVGDDSTCDSSQHESCRTDQGVSSCHCRPGYARRKLRDPCRKVVSVLVSLRVDKLYERRIVWASELSNKASDSYLQLSYETERAMDSAMSMTPFSDEFLGAKVNRIYKGERALGQAGVFVNLTLQLEENGDTARPTIRGEIQRHLLGVIQRRSNNIGNSALWVESPPGSVSSLQDLDECSSDELHDCHVLARCTNTFGSFTCVCNDGYRDPWSDNKHRAGRLCEQCPSQHCNNRGECKYQNGQQVCTCTGNYYGTQCELDGEVLGVAIGASVAAVIIIGLTLVCLVMWSRRWNREQKAAIGSPVFGYMATASNTVKTPAIGGPPYQMTLEDRLRWAQIADAMAQTNHYAPEPVMGGNPANMTRPSSAVFGYPTSLSMAGTLPHHHHHHGGTLPPIPLPRLNLPGGGQLGMMGGLGGGRAASVHGMRPLENSSSSEEEDKTDLLGRGFQVPRPKSRSNASIANQSGIYYDVDYDQNDMYKHPGSGIPMSTYTAGRHPYYRN